MPLQSQVSQYSRRALFAAFVLALVPVLLPVSGVVPTASADTAPSITLCSGFDMCAASGRGHGGYKSAKSKMYWNMFSGVNCTNYVAYRMISAGMSATRPAELKSGRGNATYWGGSFGNRTNTTPIVGSVAWWKANTNGVGGAGHVALVEQVLANGDIVISESNYGSEFTWRQIAKGGNRWPTGFIHLRDTTTVPTVIPRIGGTPQVGGTLIANPGTWRPAATSYGYQWYVDQQAVAGANGSTFTLAPAHLGRSVQVRVWAGRVGYVSGSFQTSSAPAIQPGTQVATDDPAVVGTPQVDQVLTARPGSYSPGPQSTSIQWLADGQPISGATGATFVPSAAQANARISLKVTAVRTGYAPLVRTSSPTAPVAAPTIGSAAGRTSISGARRVGETLTATMPAVTPASATKTYTWFRDGVRIPVARGATYKLRPIDVGHTISASVALSAKGYLSRTVNFGRVSGILTPLRATVRTDVRSSKSVWVRVILTPPAGKKPSGRVDIKVGKELRRGVLRKDGSVRLHFTRPGTGKRAIKVFYKGDSRFEKTRAQATIKVPDPGKKKARK